MFRVDKKIFPDEFIGWDESHCAYEAMLIADHIFNNPVGLIFRDVIEQTVMENESFKQYVEFLLLFTFSFFLFTIFLLCRNGNQSECCLSDLYDVENRPDDFEKNMKRLKHLFTMAYLIKANPTLREHRKDYVNKKNESNKTYIKHVCENYLDRSKARKSILDDI
jgi:hypothetical protein